MYPNPSDVIPLPPRLNFEQYKKRAKDLVKACKSGERSAVTTWAAEWIESLATLSSASITRRREWFGHQVNQVEAFAWKTMSNPDRPTRTCTLADAQFVIARAWVQELAKICRPRRSAHSRKFPVLAVRVGSGGCYHW
jgi:hypothetical protein